MNEAERQMKRRKSDSFMGTKKLLVKRNIFVSTKNHRGKPVNFMVWEIYGNEVGVIPVPNTLARVKVGVPLGSRHVAVPWEHQSSVSRIVAADTDADAQCAVGMTFVAVGYPLQRRWVRRRALC